MIGRLAPTLCETTVSSCPPFPLNVCRRNDGMTKIEHVLLMGDASAMNVSWYQGGPGMPGVRKEESWGRGYFLLAITDAQLRSLLSPEAKL
jgi:hypothetical protein